MPDSAKRSYRFVQVDVFTDRIFGGNPLAVFLDGEGLSDEEMQAIANEMNLSETTFVLPPADPRHAARVRIFMPSGELPFAGHPTIGTTWVLAVHGRLPAGATNAVLEEGIGPVPVWLEGDPAIPSMIWMRHPPTTFGSARTDRAAIARALRLDPADLLDGAPILVGSTGVASLYVPLRDREAVDRAVPDLPTLHASPFCKGALGVFVFAPDPDPAAGRVYSRLFPLDMPSIPEDPATGSASGPLGLYLVREGLVAAGDEVNIVSEQGTKMGRQSWLHIRLRREADNWAIEVGGGVVPVLTGELSLPADS
ncbi:MAG: PhzF family phenazine biosynthesis protein [Thermomicrobiales bacterium]